MKEIADLGQIKPISCISFLAQLFKTRQNEYSFINYSFIASKSGLTRSYIRQVFLGKKKLSLQSLFMIISALKLSPQVEAYLIKLYERDEAREAGHSKLTKRFEKDLELIRRTIKRRHKVSEKNFNTVLWPRVFASLGAENEGASFDEIISRSNMKPAEVKLILEELTSKKIVQFQDGKYHAIANHLDLGQSSFYKKFFLHNCDLFKEKANSNFYAEDQLLFSSVTCIKKENLEKMKVELKKLMVRYIDKNEDSQGDSTVTLLSGLLENTKRV